MKRPWVKAITLVKKSLFIYSFIHPLSHSFILSLSLSLSLGGGTTDRTDRFHNHLCLLSFFSEDDNIFRCPTTEKLSVLGIPDESSDVILEIEGRQLQANKAVLAHYSPVFHKTFYSDFKEKVQTIVPLPGKTYDQMAKFFNVLCPQSPTSANVITGNCSI